MLLDHYMPQFHTNEVHSVRIPSAPPDLYRLVRHLDFSESGITRTLFFLRGLPTSHMTLDAMVDGKAFSILEESADEFVVGGVGRPGGDLIPVPDSASFVAATAPGLIKIGWNFSLHPQADGSTIVRTETRVLSTDWKARLAFAAYWIIVRPFSGLIRLEMLRIVKNQAASSPHV